MRGHLLARAGNFKRPAEVLHIGIPAPRDVGLRLEGLASAGQLILRRGLPTELHHQLRCLFFSITKSTISKLAISLKVEVVLSAESSIHKITSVPAEERRKKEEDRVQKRQMEALYSLCVVAVAEKRLMRLKFHTCKCPVGSVTSLLIPLHQREQVIELRSVKRMTEVQITEFEGMLSYNH
ncbi:hypothetical protein HAX54_019309 [Datura stramonium]|uniref:Uncharacterized protein n=1 Tax=Datura stramonium TaxID=4076 RepID=A0ABS8UR68_DATST|nr:hypothetical protein [Datura stramonium]